MADMDPESRPLPKDEYRRLRREEREAEREHVQSLATCSRCTAVLAAPGICAKCLAIGGFQKDERPRHRRRREDGVSRSRAGR